MAPPFSSAPPSSPVALTSPHPGSTESESVAVAAMVSLQQRRQQFSAVVCRPLGFRRCHKSDPFRTRQRHRFPLLRVRVASDL
eukprot:CAMPEP_0113575880 /NCGR_PEP_ID=MMETSP0015_2-20120614/27958_1 /TAXON_ID=2838 /ORGANISM="Odontella" /LENGTH=82 /DNA_ID=CAMNT_0000479197 /DNA_START=290 /DNA_END=535 /DNA_ORIENTATION=+ /assembly_acc=CAM_ASM_000160